MFDCAIALAASLAHQPSFIDLNRVAWVCEMIKWDGMLACSRPEAVLTFDYKPVVKPLHAHCTISASPNSGRESSLGRESLPPAKRSREPIS